MNTKVGELIRHYRNEKNLSQIDLEVGIGAAFGSLTKIENGKINPSKETLYKIIDFLELGPAYALRLFNIDMSFFGDIIGQIKLLGDVDRLDEVMSIALNDVRELLGIAGGAFYLVEEGELRLKSLSRTPMMAIALKIVKDPFRMFKFDLAKDTENLLVQAVLQNQILVTSSLYEMARPNMSKWLADRAQKVTFNQELIALPISVNGEVIGLITYGSLYNNGFRYELQTLKLFVAEIGTALERLSN